MKTTKTKTVYTHFTGTTLVPVFGGVQCPLILVAAASVEWCDNGQEWAFERVQSAFVCIGTNDALNTPPSRFLAVEFSGKEFDGLEQEHKNQICEMAKEDHISEYAKNVIDYWHSPTQYSTVTITEKI